METPSTEKQEKKAEPIRRVFQCLSPDHTPTQVVTYMSEGYTDKDGFRRGPEACVIDRNRAGQFILRPDAKHYDEQLAALRRICKKKPHQFREVGLNAENVVLPEWAPPQTEAQKMQELKLAVAENSDQIHKLASTVEEKDKKIAELLAEVAELRKRGGK